MSRKKISQSQVGDANTTPETRMTQVIDTKAQGKIDPMPTPASRTEEEPAAATPNHKEDDAPEPTEVPETASVATLTSEAPNDKGDSADAEGHAVIPKMSPADAQLWPDLAPDPFADPSVVRPIPDDVAAANFLGEGKSCQSNDSKFETLPVGTQQCAQHFTKMFELLGSDGEAKRQGVEMFTKASHDFCNLLSNKTPEEQVKITANIYHGTLSPIMMKADTLRVVSAIISGKMANSAKSRLNHGEWQNLFRRHFPGNSLKVVQENMRLANILNVENHCEKGLTLLKKLCIVAESYPFNAGEDPIKAVLDYAMTKSEAIELDHTILAALAIADYKLNKAKLNVPLPALYRFYQQKLTITLADIKEMQAMKNAGLEPVSHLERIIKNAGSRVFPLTKPVVKAKKADTDTTAEIPDINATFVKTSEIITEAINSGKLSAKDVNPTIYETLLSSLESFKKFVFHS